MSIKRLRIMRGIPGSGKSTYAAQHFPGALVVSNDHFFIAPDGQYRFDPLKLQEAANACMRAFLSAVQAECELIVVDNTNVTTEELAPFIAVGTAFGYEVRVITIHCDAELAHGRNIHSVPLSTVRSRHALLLRTPNHFPRWWDRSMFIDIDNNSGGSMT